MKIQPGNCSGCGIPMSDGYCEDCSICRERRRGRCKRGERFTPTGYPGELIDNECPRGTLVAGTIEGRAA